MLVVALTEERKRKVERVFRGAFHDRGWTLLRGAQEAEKDIGQFSRILAGLERHLDPLTKQDDEYWRALGENIVLEFGISRRARLAAKLRALTIGRKRQARMDAQIERQEVVA